MADAKGILVLIPFSNPDRLGQPQPVPVFKPVLPYPFCAVTEAVVPKASGCRNERHDCEVVDWR